jgi:hypothetical protein
MTPAAANLLLDKVREGQIYDFEQITAALIATGDLAGWRETHLVGSLAAGMRSEGLVAPVQDTPAREGREVCERVVVGHDREDRENPRPWCSAYLAARYEQVQT